MLRPSRKPERAITSRSPFFASLGTDNPLGRHRLHATKQITHQPHPAAVYSRKRANISSSALVPDAAMKRAAAVPTGRYSAAAFWILSMLSVFHFALAAPVAVLEVRSNAVDAPKDEIAAWEKRMDSNPGVDSKTDADDMDTDSPFNSSRTSRGI
ncbi:hypothetical protein BGY98DRAFT_1093558 [Russula aff. rugulosa BPL654]|nr:hypothetical protein BGY98DRAFT_1093558 [Russula aff. rugulosa BPL654]